MYYNLFLIIILKNQFKIEVDKKKIEVSVMIFGRKTPMELSYMQVEKL